MKVPATKKEALELVSQMHKEIRLLEEVVEGARLHEEVLIEYIREICYLIYPHETILYTVRTVSII